MQQKDWWDKSKIIAFIMVPILIAWYGNSINSTLKQREIETKYVEIAAGILREKPDKEGAALRSWAIEVLRSYSTIPLSTAAVEELKKKPLPGRTYLTDEKGNVLTDGKGNKLTTE